MEKMGKDPVLSALESVHSSLKPLKPEERQKVLASISTLLEISNSPLAPLAPNPPVTPLVPSAPHTRPKSLVELVQEKQPGTNLQRIALFAYYREKFEGLARFARTDLEGYFAKARFKPPTNYDRDFVEAVKKGWIHEDGGDSYITSKGIEATEAGFPGERKVTRPARQDRGRKKNRRMGRK